MAKRQHLQRLAASRAAVVPTAPEDPSAPVVLGPDGLPVPPTPVFPAGLQQPIQPPGHRHPWEHVEEILSILKTAFPLLALSMEMIVDQVSTRFKPLPDEDIYRLISALLNDGLQVRISPAAVRD